MKCFLLGKGGIKFTHLKLKTVLVRNFSSLLHADLLEKKVGNSGTREQVKK